MREGLDFDSYVILGVDFGGTQVARRLADLAKKSEFVTCNIDDEGINFSDLSLVQGHRILVCDDSTNTGTTFKNVFKKLISLGIRDIRFFSLMMRRNSSVVPNIFVFETDEDTKVYFPWSDYPIRTYSKGIVRKISYEDCGKDFLCGEQRIDKIPLSDFFKNQEHLSARVYVVEDRNMICSIIQFYERNVDAYKGLFLDVIATAETVKGNKYAKVLLKLVSYYMIYHKFDFLYAFDDEQLLDMYRKRGFEIIGTVKDPHYNTLHKIVIVNGAGNKKEKVMATIRSCV